MLYLTNSGNGFFRLADPGGRQKITRPLLAESSLLIEKALSGCRQLARLETGLLAGHVYLRVDRRWQEWSFPGQVLPERPFE